MTSHQECIDRYAALVVRVAANVQPGQQVVVMADISHAPIVRAVAEDAYAVGASRVFVDYADPLVRRSALLHAPEEGLRDVRPWELARLEEWEESGTAVIRLTGNADPHVFDGIDPGRLAITGTEWATRFRQVLLGGSVQWTIVAAPNPGWAEQVFGEPDLDRLWAAVEVAMRLDAGDADAVVEEWRRHPDRLGSRAATLTGLGLTRSATTAAAPTSSSA